VTVRVPLRSASRYRSVGFVKKIFSLLMIVCLAVSFSVGMVGCQEQAPAPSPDEPLVEEELTEEEKALEAAIGEDQPEQEETVQ
jgi:hypothetical protein